MSDPFEIPVGEARFTPARNRERGYRVRVRQEDPTEDLSGQKIKVKTRSGDRTVRLTKRLARGTTEKPSLYAFGSSSKEEK